MSEIKTYSVSEINNFIKESLENDSNLKDIAIKGEISNLTHHQSGHIYFSLKDIKTKINCLIFSFNAKNLNIKLTSGMSIIAIGSITVYPPQGTYTFQIKTVIADGVGILYQKFQKLKDELQKKGWFDQSIKKVLPKFPKNIGIITADTGAAIRDIIITLKRRYPLVNIYLFACLVQGANAAPSISKQINIANNFKPELDLLIVGRGGGSIEDLWAFNELIVAQAIFQSKIPIISAVGHEIDYTIADFIADVRAATPTAAAEIATPNIVELKQYLKHQTKTLINNLKTIFNNKNESLEQINNNYLFKNPQKLLLKFQQKFEIIKNHFTNQKNEFITKEGKKISNYQTQLYDKIKKLINIKQQKLIYIKNDFKFSYNKYWINTNNNFQQLITKLNILSPLNTLKRGYSISKIDNTIITSIKNIKSEQLIQTIVSDGIIISKIKEIKREE